VKILSRLASASARALSISEGKVSYRRGMKREKNRDYLRHLQ
jgi:hypothetical protein